MTWLILVQQRHFADQIVDLAGGHSGRDKAGERIEDFRGKAACLAHSSKTLFAM